MPGGMGGNALCHGIRLISPDLIDFDFINFVHQFCPLPKSHKQRVRVDDRCMQRNMCHPNQS